MKGKISGYGLLYKEVLGEGMVPCLCVNKDKDIPELAGLCLHGPVCYHRCVAFDGPLPEKECAQVDGDGTICPGRCEKCELFRPTGRTEIHYCKGVLRFDEFVDERVPK